MEAVEKSKMQQDNDIARQKLVDMQASYNQSLKSTQKYKDLYKKAYDIVDKLKQKESASKQVISNLEMRVNAVEARRGVEAPKLRQKWDAGGDW